MAKRIRKKQIQIAPYIYGKINDDGTYHVIDKKNNINLNPSDIKDKIIIYERQVKGWFIEPTQK